MREQSGKHAARGRDVIWPATLAGFVARASAGLLAAPDVIALPGLLGLSGLALGLLVGLTIAWRRASEPAVDRQLADEPVRWPLAAPQANHAPGWYADPGDSGARRYWDAESWTAHLWRDRKRPQRRENVARPAHGRVTHATRRAAVPEPPARCC